MNNPNELRAYDGLLRNDFRAFVEKVFATLSPGQKFERSWHLEAVERQLERVRLHKVRRSIINLPPRSLKSVMSSVALPAFALGHDPTLRIVCISYSGDLARKHSNDFRAIVESSWYNELFPQTRIGEFKNSETEIEFTRRGSRLTTSVGGTLTGRGGDLIIIDDPLRSDDAMSESRRNAVNQWFTNTVMSRLDDKRTGAIVIVAQRVHIDDLTGFVLSQSKDWEVLSLPAIAESDEEIPIWEGFHNRKIGDVLSPEREPRDVLEKMKLEIGSDAFSAQYQQAPTPPGGAMIKRQWILRYDELPPRMERRFILQSWDTASKGGPENDWSVCTTWIIGRDRQYYLADVWRARADYPTLKARVRMLAKVWRAARILIEDVGAGSSLVQELRFEISGLIPVTPQRDKVSRMSAVSAKFEAGQVCLPRQASWLPDYEAELFSFPGSRHDDQIDATSQALGDRSNRMLVFSGELSASLGVRDRYAKNFRFK